MSAEIRRVESFLTQKGFCVEMVPGATPGDMPRVLDNRTKKPVDTDGLAVEVSSAALLYSLLMDRATNAINQEEFVRVGGRVLRKEFSRRPKPPKPETLMIELSKKLPGARYRKSLRGVPMVVVGEKSICYFGSSQIYRVFDNYGKFNVRQERLDFETQEQVLQHFATKMASR